jgi:hypothetical protein
MMILAFSLLEITHLKRHTLKHGEKKKQNYGEHYTISARFRNMIL